MGRFARKFDVLIVDAFAGAGRYPPCILPDPGGSRVYLHEAQSERRFSRIQYQHRYPRSVRAGGFMNWRSDSKLHSGPGAICRRADHCSSATNHCRSKSIGPGYCPRDRNNDVKKSDNPEVLAKLHRPVTTQRKTSLWTTELYANLFPYLIKGCELAPTASAVAGRIKPRNCAEFGTRAPAKCGAHFSLPVRFQRQDARCSDEN